MSLIKCHCSNCDIYMLAQLRLLNFKHDVNSFVEMSLWTQVVKLSVYLKLTAPNTNVLCKEVVRDFMSCFNKQTRFFIE